MPAGLCPGRSAAEAEQAAAAGASGGPEQGAGLSATRMRAKSACCDGPELGESADADAAGDWSSHIRGYGVCVLNGRCGLSGSWRSLTGLRWGES